MFRKATEKDLDQITELYSDVHTEEEAGNTTIGWIRSIYPTRITVETAFAADDLFVEVDDEKIVAVARINQEQVDVYGGDKMSTIEATARLRFKEFNGGSFLDLLREVYCVSEEDLMPLVAKFLQTIESQVFNYTLDKASFHNFLISDVKELDKQFDRFMNPDNN